MQQVSSMTSKLKRNKISVIPISRELDEELLKDFKGEQTGWFLATDQKYLLPSKYEKQVEDFYHCPIRENDIWISTFPRSGTTLTQELVWILVNNFDFETASKYNLWERTPFFEINLFLHDNMKSLFLKENFNNPENQQIVENMSIPGYQVIKKIPSPRIIKTHYPLSLLPAEVHEKHCKVIYVARNPKDVIISYYYLSKRWRTLNYVSSFKKFWNHFKQGHVPWAPFWSHVEEGWNHRNDGNVLFLFYEDIVKDIEGTIKKIAGFLSIPVSSEKVIALADHLSIKSFSKNPTVNFESFKEVGIITKEGESFVRTGAERKKPADITEGIENEIDEWINENYKKVDFRFPVKNKME